MKNNDRTSHKPHLFVAAGIIFNQEGEVLLANRPAGKTHAGYWEFPGGKVEAGETALVALIRELEEELGITVVDAYPWREQTFDYPHATVSLSFFQVTAWQGEIVARENQQFAWQAIHQLTVSPLLPANEPLLQALRAEKQTVENTRPLACN